MKIYKGISELINAKEQLPQVGWLFIEKSFDTVSPTDILSKNFMIAEDVYEEIDAEKKYSTWLEVPTFVDVLNLKLKANPQATTKDIVEAAIYYLENDAFM